MTVQMRGQGPGALAYAPHRDCSFNFPKLAAMALESLLPDKQTYLSRAILEHEAGVVKLDRLAVAFQSFLEHTNGPDEGGFAGAISRSGFTELPPLVQAAFLAELGRVLTCLYYPSVRDAYAQNQTPDTVAEYFDAAKKIAASPVWRPSLWTRLCRFLAKFSAYAAVKEAT